MYDQWLGRTWQVDPMSEKFHSFSPYSWGMNNPLVIIDPTGMVSKHIYDQQEDGSYVKREGVENDGGENNHMFVNNDGTTHYVNQETGSSVTLNADGEVIDSYQSEGKEFDFSESFGAFMQTREGQNAKETAQNVVMAGAMIFTGGASSSVQLSGGAAKLLQSSFGKGVFDILGQALVKGGFDNIDYADAAASALIGNKYVKNLAKSFVDLSSDGVNISSINEGLAEFGLRVSVDAASSPISGGASKYVMDIIKKEQRKEIVNSLK